LYEKGVEEELSSIRVVKDDAESIYTKQSGIRQFSLGVTVKIRFSKKGVKKEVKILLYRL
jgi:hypothetical protein